MLLITTTKGLEALERTWQIDTNEWCAKSMAWEDLCEELEGAGGDFDADFVVLDVPGGAIDALPADEAEAVDGLGGADVVGGIIGLITIDEVESIYPEEDVIWVRTDAGWVRYAGA